MDTAPALLSLNNLTTEKEHSAVWVNTRGSAGIGEKCKTGALIIESLSGR